MSYRCTLVIQESATAQQLFLSGSRSLLKHDLQKHVIICKQVHSFYTQCVLILFAQSQVAEYSVQVNIELVSR